MQKLVNGSETNGGSVTGVLPIPPWEQRAAWAKSVIANMRPPESPDLTKGGAFVPHVYLAYSAGRIKIGTSINTKGRGKKLAGDSALPVTIIFTVPGGPDLERRLHECLASERLHGEWFRISPEMRKLLDGTLCRTGMRKFKRAEAEFRKWIRSEAELLR